MDGISRIYRQDPWVVEIVADVNLGDHFGSQDGNVVEIRYPLKLTSGNDERHAQCLWPTAMRPVMQRDEDVRFLVSSVVGVCARLLCIAWLENGFVDVVTRVHGHTVFAECLAVRPHSLLLHGSVFHPRCCYIPRIWYWAATIWAIRVEMDW